MQALWSPQTARRRSHTTASAFGPYVYGSESKLQPRDWNLVTLMDGTRTLPALVIRDFKLHQVLAPSRVAGLVRLLQDNHFLTDAPAQSSTAQRDAGARNQTDLTSSSAESPVGGFRLATSDR